MTLCVQPECLTLNNSEHKFCQKCGKKLLLSERYRAIKKIGEGGFGITFYAIDQHTWDTDCVIKQFIPLQSGSGALNKCIELFKQESKLLKELGKHPQIPDLFAFFEQENNLYLIQEFIDGQDLLKELQAKKRYSEAEVKEFLVSLLSVIEFIHGHNILHRDIKLENIIRRQDGVLMLIDFGISKQTTATIATKMGTIVGTPGYAPPEQMRGLTHPSSDLYSLAVTAMRMLTGCLPEEKNGTLVDELFDVYQMEWIWQSYLSKNGISVSQELALILDKMLQDKVNNRFQSATEVLQSLNPQKNPDFRSLEDFGSLKPTQIQTPNKPKSPLKIDLGKGVILELVEIPAGSFLMGSEHGYDYEKPRRQITLNYNFLMGKYPVTQSQYEAIMGNNPSHFSSPLTKGGSGGMGYLPVECVSWHDAVNFCQKLSQKTGRKFRLPSEAEWEYAARATKGGQGAADTKYFFGNNEKDLNKYAWYTDNSNIKTHPVGQKLANSWGLFDLLGNVWEWCEDDWQRDLTKYPTDGRPYLGNSSMKSLRGGSWYNHAGNCRCARRDFNYADNRNHYIGLRVVVSPNTL